MGHLLSAMFDIWSKGQFDDFYFANLMALSTSAYVGGEMEARLAGGLQLRNPGWNFEIFEVDSIQGFCKKVETRVHIEIWGEM